MIKRKVYVDMDGVIADFFKALENKYNVKHWKELDIDKTIKDLKGTDLNITINQVMQSLQVEKKSMQGIVYIH